MSKEKKKIDEDVTYVNIGDYCIDIMKVFGANNNLMRHLSDVRDGLKPGERRLLYTMYKMGLKPTVNHKKVETIMGTTMGIHPHGDAPLHKTITGLAQVWNNTLELVDGYGNFGTQGGGKAAAGRYIEARLSKFAWKCYFEDFDPDAVDMKIAYDGVTPEPEYLPSRYPVSLFNSHFGIGYGTSCSIPPYNFNEVIDLTMELMDDPETENILLYPDLPTSAFIIDDGQFKKACETGDSNFRMRGNAYYVEKDNLIRIDTIPYQVSTKKVVLDIIDLLDQNKISGIKDIKNRTSKKNGICVDILLKKGADPISIINTIYKKTDVQKTFSIDLKMINDYEEVHYNIRTLLLEWINFRRSIKRRLYSHKLRKLYERQHIVQTMIFILEGDRLDKTTEIFKTSENRAEIAKRLMKAYPGKVSSLQADSIASMHGYEMTKSARKGFETELKELTDKEIPKLEKIVKSTKKIDAKIKAELQEGVKLFGGPRLSKVINVKNELQFRNTKHTLVFTGEGMIKKLPDPCDSIGTIGKDDFPTRVIKCENKDSFLVFDETGRVSLLKVHQVSNTDYSSKGIDLKEYCGVNGRIIDIIRKPEEGEFSDKLMDSLYLFMVSKNGLVKKTPFKAFMTMSKTLLGMIMKNDADSLQAVKLLSSDKDILLYTSDGYGIKFNSADIKETSRMSMGVKTIDSATQIIIGADTVGDKDTHMLLVTSKGYIKKAPMDTFGTATRTSKPVRIMGLNSGDELVSVKTVSDDDTYIVYTKDGATELVMEDIQELPRLSKGKKIVPVKKGDSILYVKKK